jgi:protein-S-isoprenylcysteine O-methyltransferase Ste14
MWRIKAEEALPRRSFGERYVDYDRRTRRPLEP